MGCCGRVRTLLVTMLLAWRQALRSHCCPHLRLMNIPYLLSVLPIPFHRRGNVVDDVALHKPPWDSFLGGIPLLKSSTCGPLEAGPGSASDQSAWQVLTPRTSLDRDW